MKTAKLSARQQEALELVKQGRVQYGHEFPNMARRGHAAYNQQGRTFAALEERGLLVIRHDLVPHEPKPATTRTSRTLTGESTITIPAHDAPVDPGWRTAVELATSSTDSAED